MLIWYDLIYLLLKGDKFIVELKLNLHKKIKEKSTKYGIYMWKSSCNSMRTAM